MRKKVLLSEVLDRYRREVSILKRGYATEKFRLEQLARSSLGKKFAHEVTSVDIATYRDDRLKMINKKTKKILSTSTVRLEMSLLSNVFDIARIEWGYASTNPVANVRKPKSAPSRIRRITPREEKMILRYSHNHTNPEMYSIFVIAVETAMRQGEIINLHWEHINLKTRIAHLPETKNGDARDVPLSIRARDALLRMGVQRKGKVFNYTSSGVKSTWRFMMQALGIKDLHFHDARHEACSRMAELGTLDILEIAAISGHKSLSMLKRYTHHKTQRLVRKLDGSRNKNQQVMSELMIAYPADIEQQESEFVVRLLDFKNLSVRAANREDAIKQAGRALLENIALMAFNRIPIPAPDQYLGQVDEDRILMINPLPITSLDSETFELAT